MTEQPPGTGSMPEREQTDRKQTEISDLPQADGADEAEDVRGGAALIIPCIRTRQVEPCWTPIGIVPCVRARG